MESGHSVESSCGQVVRHSRIGVLAVIAMALMVLGFGGCGTTAPAEKEVPKLTVDDYIGLSRKNDMFAVQQALDRMDANWQPGYRTLIIELLRFAVSDLAKSGSKELLTKHTKWRDVSSVENLMKKIWLEPYEPVENYPEFKAGIYARIDPTFAEYFSSDFETTIRLDEIMWGGVRRDGIPPLKDPKMTKADDAGYLGDNNVVFGVYANGEARCYPKRIMGWHEMVKDVVGGVSLNGVYCTLCGSMIFYYTELDGKHYELGTSGFLFRSNKLMYDHETKSMWNTITGEPVVGQLVGKGIQLKRHHVVTTTWGQWKKDHPDTLVLDIDTGYKRDYGEGIAYKDYFATDELMFKVPKSDPRLRNKQEVLALIFEEKLDEQLAISADFLAENPVYHDELGGVKFVVITDEAGANRVYRSGERTFASRNEGGKVTDSEGLEWTVSEMKMTSSNGDEIERLPGHRAFWFGWRSMYDDTRLVK